MNFNFNVSDYFTEWNGVVAWDTYSPLYSESYLEVYDTNHTMLDKFYIGACKYTTDQFNLNHFIQHPTNSYMNLSDPNYPKIISHSLWNNYHVDKLAKVAREYEPETLDEMSALYDINILLYWIHSQQETHKHCKFTLVTHSIL